MKVTPELILAGAAVIAGLYVIVRILVWTQRNGGR